MYIIFFQSISLYLIDQYQNATSGAAPLKKVKKNKFNSTWTAFNAPDTGFYGGLQTLWISLF